MNDIRDLKLFMIGAGALGCELIKGFALMGTCCSPKGHLHCTDNDLIEWTNLNRQFLFRQTDVGKPKSDTACNAGRLINDEFKYTSYKDLVVPETDYKFNAEFWEEKDIIIGAVDNMMARRYVNAKCLWYGKTYLDSGTLGPRCNNTVIIANKSKSFTSVPDPGNAGQIPMCTVKNFPIRIEHTIEWSRSIFNDYFISAAKELQEFVKDSKDFMQKMKDSQTAFGFIQILERIKTLVNAKTKSTIEECTIYARKVFDYVFRDCIVALLTAHPLDEVQNGVGFWGVSRRPPTIINFDPNNPLHNLFLISFVKLLFKVLKKEFKKEDEENIMVIAKKLTVTESIKVDKEGLDLEEEKRPTGVFSENDLKVIDGLCEELKGMTKGWNENEVTPIEFEKDDDLIIDLIHSAANIRADNYNIKQCDKQKSKFTAGNIMPAMATTTALIIGLVLSELIKVAQKFTDLDRHRAIHANTALNTYWVTKVEKAELVKGGKNDDVLGYPTIAIPEGLTEWDKINIRGPIAIEQLISHIEKTYNVEVNVIISGKFILYRKYSKQRAKFQKMIIETRFEEAAERKLSDTEKYLELAIEGFTMKEGNKLKALMPKFKYIFKP